MRKAAFALVILLFLSQSAFGTFHLFQIVKVFSNASGTVQYIDIFTTSPGQEFWGGQMISSNGHSFMFPANLPATPSHTTANQHVLLGTPGYVALSGVPAVDYNLGVNNFFNVNGDTINFAGVNTFTFISGQVPTDGVHQAERAFNSSTITSTVSSPTNFAGVAGTIPQIPATPAPPSLILTLTGLTGAGLYLAWHRHRRGPGRVA